MIRLFFFVSLFLATALLFSASPVEAGTAKAARKHVESSMVLTGSIDVDPDGTVAAIALDQERDLSDVLSSFVRSTLTQWHFEPVRDEQGNALAVRAPMHLRLIARVMADDKAEIGIRSVDFSPESSPDDLTKVRFKDTRPPSYPRDAARASLAADTFVMAKVGRDGRVEDLITRQVNLRSIGSERVMRKWRAEFAKASERAIRDWKFKVPTEGPQADAPYWVVTVPVIYRLSPDRSKSQYGKWQAYVAGPLHPAPWLDPNEVRNLTSPDALADGGVYMAREDGLRLLTPLDAN